MKLREAVPTERRLVYVTEPPKGYVLGPVPCHDCHVPLFWAPYAGWRERLYRRDYRVPPRLRAVRQRNGQSRLIPSHVGIYIQFDTHVCTARERAA